MGLTAIFFFGTLGLTAVLLRMMGMPFDYVALIVVGLLFVALAGLLTVMQIQENRTRRWLEKKWFPQQAAQRAKATPWYRRRPWVLGLLAVVAAPVLALRLLAPASDALPVAQKAPVRPAAAPVAASAPAAAVTPAATPATPPAVAATAAATTSASASTSAPAAPAPVVNAPAADARAALQATVQAWAQAWSAGDADAYLRQYSASFQPAAQQSRSAWERTRRQRVTPEQNIRVELDALELVAVDAQQAQIRFVQRYTSRQLQDRSRKQLDLVLENGQWKIAAETVLGAVAP